MTTKNSQPKIEKRPPVVAVVGHIDHGKSTLLDFIRKSNIVAKEVGGITQQIAAYEVVHQTENGEKRTITFLDTPGHEAFSSMRARGAQISDVAILVVSAEDGVKAQTLEALKAVKEAGIPFLVAINKIDKPNANVEKIKGELAEHEIYLESYGGTIPSVNISAKVGTGIPELLEVILLLADLNELTGDRHLAGRAIVLESNRDAKVGVTATVIVKDGTLKVGDFLAAEEEVIKIKKIENFLGQSVKDISFSSPALIYGFTKVPNAGSEVKVLADKKAADVYLKDQAETKTSSFLNNSPKVNSGEEIGEITELAIVIKTDTVGTKEAVLQEVAKINDERLKLKIVNSSIGQITQADVAQLAASNNSIILGFNVKADKEAETLAEKQNTTIALFDIIYKLSEWLENEVATRRPKVTTEEITGSLKILKTFSQTKDKQVIGGLVVTGTFKRSKEVKIKRRDVEIGHGKIQELEQMKVKADQVQEGNQCGVMVESKIVLAPGDVLDQVDRIAK